jgi:hypothetical protein
MRIGELEQLTWGWRNLRSLLSRQLDPDTVAGRVRRNPSVIEDHREHGLFRRSGMAPLIAPCVSGYCLQWRQERCCCARCGELIAPEDMWELDHRDDARGWLGPSHRACNARAGWQKMVNSNGDASMLEERPYRWSQRGFEDPPVGTTVNLGDGLIEVHVVRGVWRTYAVPL